MWYWSHLENLWQGTSNATLFAKYLDFSINFCMNFVDKKAARQQCCDFRKNSILSNYVCILKINGRNF
jgi:hypothetical protein